MIAFAIAREIGILPVAELGRMPAVAIVEADHAGIPLDEPIDEPHPARKTAGRPSPDQRRSAARRVAEDLQSSVRPLA